MTMAKKHALKKIDPDPYQGGYTFGLLTHNDIPAFLALQDMVRESLDGAQKHHLKARTAEDLARHLDAGMLILGVKNADGALIAQALMTFPDNYAVKNLEAYPLDGIAHDTAVIQSVAVNPAYKGLGRMILTEAPKFAFTHGRVRIMAKVADSNLKSQQRFEGCGYIRAAQGLDPVKGYAVTYFTCSVFSACGAAQPALALHLETA